VLSDPRTAHYIAGWPRDTDLGVIAEAGSEPDGVAWVRFFPADDPAYGFVGPDVPELTIGVAAAWRGRGVGRTLLRAVAASAAEAGIGRISLSVSGRTSPAACTCPRASRRSTPATRSPTPWLRASRMASRPAQARRVAQFWQKHRYGIGMLDALTRSQRIGAGTGNCLTTGASVPFYPGSASRWSRGDGQLPAYEGRQGTGARRQYRPSVTVFDSLTHGRALPARAGPRRTAAPARRGGWPRHDGAS
jgi:GNAT superfamily N-acetyltransferase